MKTPKVTFQGRSFPSGMSVFTCWIDGNLRTFRTDAPRREARADAVAYFREIANRKTALARALA